MALYMDEKEVHTVPFPLKATTLWRHVRQHQTTLLVVSVLGIFSALANGVVPLLVGRFFDALVQPSVVTLPEIGPVLNWQLFIVLWLSAQLVANVVDWYINQKSRSLSTSIEAQYTVNAFSRLLQLPVAFF